MKRFSLAVECDHDFNLTYTITVPDGVDCRAHDVRFAVEQLQHHLVNEGARKLPTVSEVAAIKAKQAEAAAVLAEWEPTLDGVCCMGATYSRTYTKRGFSEPVVAVCDADGNPTMETAATLRAWSPSPE